MIKRVLELAGVVSGLSWSPTAALAEPEANDMPAYGWERRFALAAHAGVRNPIGLGISYEVAPVYFFVIEGGVGMGLEGPQAALATRLRLPARSMALSLGGGLSAGPFRVSNQDCNLWLSGGCTAVGSTHQWVWNAAVWRNLELSIERRSEGGFQWRFYGGGATILNPAAGRCEPIGPRFGDFGCPPNSSFSTPYLGTSLGYAF